MDIEATLNELLAQETEEGMAMEFNGDELLGKTQISSTIVKEAEKTINRAASKEMPERDTSLTATANLVCKITRDARKYFDVRSDNCNTVLAAHVCKTTEAPTDIKVRRPVCETTEISTCKTVDIVDQYFSDDDNPRPKTNIM